MEVFFHYSIHLLVALATLSLVWKFCFRQRNAVVITGLAALAVGIPLKLFGDGSAAGELGRALLIFGVCADVAIDVLGNYRSWRNAKQQW